MWASHRLQVSKQSYDTAPYHESHPSGTAPVWGPMASNTPFPPDPPWDRLQLQPRPATVGALHGLCLLQASSIAVLLHTCMWRFARGDLIHMVPTRDLSSAAKNHCSSLEHLQPSFYTDLGCTAFSHISHSPFSAPVVQQFFHFLICSLRSTASISHSSTLAVAGSFWGSWRWL